MDYIVANDGMENAIEIVRRAAALHLGADDAGPAAAFHETGERFLRGLAVAGVGKFDKFIQPAAHHVGKGPPEQIGKASVYGENCAIERDGKQQVLEGIN